MSASTALRLAGRDALALLHRISTNAAADLAPGRARATLFCDFRGRLLHRAVLGVTSDGAVWLLRDDAPGAPLAAFLDRHVFRDDVRIEDHSASLSVRWAAGLAEMAPGTLKQHGGFPTMVRPEDDDHLVVEAVAWAGTGGAPSEPGTAPDRTWAAEEVARRERSRVRAGRPAHGHEIVEAFTPYEVGLAHEVHLDKGCYTGQEVLLRLVTYRGVRRRLARVSGPGPAPDVPRDLRAGGEPAGVLTTAVADGDRWIGLAVVRNELCEPPVALELPEGDAIGPPEPLALGRPQGRP